MKDYMGNDESVEDNVRRRLDGGGCERGVVEAAEKTADNCVAFLASLTTALVANGVITEDLVDGMFNGVW